MFICLLLPCFLLQAARRWRPESSGPAVAVDEGVVKAVDATAFGGGIAPGMTSSQAMARMRDVTILPRAREQEECLNQLLSQTALGLSPEVELSGDGICVADLSKRPAPHCWQSFGDELVESFRREKLEARVGVAITPDLAVLAAKGRERVSVIYDAAAYTAQLPVAALEPSAALAQTLEDWGIARVDELTALPKGEVIERLGPEAEALLKKVSGRNKRPLQLLRPVTAYREAFDFEYEVDTTEPLLFLLKRFLNSLTERLRGAHLVAERMVLTLPLENRTAYERSFAIPAPTTEVEALYRILDTHLEMLRLEQRPVGLRLKLQAAKPKRNQLGLFESAIRDLNRFGETLARLKALLGEDRVGVPVKVDTHKPDVFALEDNFSTETPPPVPEVLRGLPLRRYRPAIPARVITTEGKPAAVQSKVARGTVSDVSGPFRISGNWWDEERWAVEEWDVELSEGGMYRLGQRRGEWTVEGSYELR